MTEIRIAFVTINMLLFTFEKFIKPERLYYTSIDININKLLVLDFERLQNKSQTKQICKVNRHHESVSRMQPLVLKLQIDLSNLW